MLLILHWYIEKKRNSLHYRYFCLLSFQGRKLKVYTWPYSIILSHVIRFVWLLNCFKFCRSSVSCFHLWLPDGITLHTYIIEEILLDLSENVHKFKGLSLNLPAVADSSERCDTLKRTSEGGGKQSSLPLNFIFWRTLRTKSVLQHTANWFPSWTALLQQIGKL